MTIAEHSFDERLLPARPRVLDVGCRGFTFGDGLKAARPLADLYEVDIDDLGTARPYYRVGIAGYNGVAGVSDCAEPFARHLTSDTSKNSVEVYTLESFSAVRRVVQWDLIKLDCEGSEFPALLNMERPLADQISVEFHPWGQYTMADVDLVVRHLLRWYVVERHVKTVVGDMSPNYWDSLFIKRGLGGAA